MELDSVHPINDLSLRTLIDLSERIARSTSEEHLVYRESEIDEVWRLLGPSHAAASEDERTAALRRVIMEVHDLVGVDSNPTAAAAKLRSVIG
jgi:hypothetical protein